MPANRWSANTGNMSKASVLPLNFSRVDAANMACDRITHRPIKVGIVGTGYAAKRRVEAFRADPRSEVLAVAGHTPAKTAAFATAHAITDCPSWQDLIAQDEIDLIAVCHANHQHGRVVRSALLAGKAVVVEYPLSLSPSEAIELIELAQQQQLLLHVEHIELLGGLHQAMQAHLAAIGRPTYVRYCTTVARHPAPQKWTYDAAMFGFPLMGALSRLHRLTDLFGTVHEVAGHLQYDNLSLQPPIGHFRNCRCTAQLRFHSGVIAEVTYGKGEQTWRSQRLMEVLGELGALVFEGDTGSLINLQGSFPIATGSRRGLFDRDTTEALDALCEGKPPYVSPQASLYTLQIADAVEQAARTNQTVMLR